MWTKFIGVIFIASVSFLTPVDQIMAALSDLPAGSYCVNCVDFENEKIKYFKSNQYAEFIDFLNNSKIKDKLSQSCINYYKALTRYSQLSYLEEKQSWDDYFTNGNSYRDEIVQNTKEIFSKEPAGNCLRLRSRLLVWQFHHGQQDVFTEQALIDLLIELKAYAQTSNDAALIKNIADVLLLSKETAKAKELYRIYADKLVKAKVTDLELKTVAAGFYKDGNLELAQIVFDIYIEKISKNLSPDKFTQELLEIAGMFVYKSSGLYDMVYAEDIYVRIDGLNQKNPFGQEQIYLRAFNLEKMKELNKARDFYLQLIKLYADSKHFDEAVYKVAMIDAYVLADIQEARSYFEKLTAKVPITPWVSSSFYQLGLFSQWENDLVKASDYYNILLKNSGDTQNAIVILAQERLKEIQENKPINYNLKTFLDLSFKDTKSFLEMSQSELASDNYILKKDQNIVISSLVNMPQSGCNQVELQYLWSGNLGQASPSATSPGFECSYSDIGTKEINMVTVSSAGVIDRSFIMVDVY